MNLYDFTLGQEQGIEDVLTSVFEQLNHAQTDMQAVLKHWKSEYRSNAYEVDRVNRFGFKLWKMMITASRLIDMFEDMIHTRDFEQEKQQIEDIEEILGSWDLHVSFGWKMENRS